MALSCMVSVMIKKREKERVPATTFEGENKWIEDGFVKTKARSSYTYPIQG